MLPGLLYLFGLIAFGVVLWWAIRNDAPGVEGGNKGLLAMGPAPRKKGRRSPKGRSKWERTDTEDQAESS